MSATDDNEFVLRDVYLYGLDEISFPGLLRKRGASPIGSSRSSVKLDEALFIPFPDADIESGRYQSVMPGILFTSDGMTGLMEVVVKFPRVDSANAEESRALAHLEAEKADRFQEFGNIFALPLGHATVSAQDSEAESGILDGEVCNIQGRVTGKTLLELFYEPSADPNSYGEMVVNQAALWKFFEERDPEDVWLACEGESHMPFVPVLEHIFLDIAEDLRQLENMGLQHNDISPANIMWSREKGFKLVDLALVSEIGSPALGSGTAPYAPFGEPPEVVSRGTDIRALYAICWELLGYKLSADRDSFSAEISENGQYVRFASDAVIARIIDSEDLNAAANPIEEISKVRAKDAIKAAQQTWYTEFCEALLGQNRNESVSAEFAWERTDRAVKRLKANIRGELDGENRKQDGKRGRTILVLLLIASALTAGFSNAALQQTGGFLLFAIERAIPFFVVSLALSIMPLILGIFGDSAVAWRSYLKEHPEEAFSWKKYQTVAKYGDLDGIVDGAGRFDPSLKHCVYFALCNILGALCNVSLLLSLFLLDGFETYVIQNGWLSNWSLLALPFAAFAAWSTEVGVQSMPRLNAQDDAAENPDIHAFTRFHVWGNTVHLVWTFFWIIISCLSLLAFLRSNFHGMPCQPVLVIPIIMFAAFVLHSTVSDRALSVGAEALGSLQLEALVLTIVPVVIAFVLFKPTIASSIYLAIAVGATVIFVLIRRKLLASEGVIRHGIIVKERDEIVKWVDRSKRNGYVTIAIIAAIFGFAFAAWSLGTLT